MTTSAPSPWSRRSALLGGAALALAGCGRKTTPTAVRGKLSLDEAVAGVWRDPADKTRDVWRHPALHENQIPTGSAVLSMALRSTKLECTPVTPSMRVSLFSSSS